MAYLQKLRGIIAERGSANIVDVDEAGFEPAVCHRYGWSQRGQQVHGDTVASAAPEPA